MPWNDNQGGNGGGPWGSGGGNNNQNPWGRRPQGGGGGDDGPDLDEVVRDMQRKLRGLFGGGGGNGGGKKGGGGASAFGFGFILLIVVVVWFESAIPFAFSFNPFGVLLFSKAFSFILNKILQFLSS